VRCVAARAARSLSADALEAGIEHFAQYQKARGKPIAWIPELIRMDDMSPDKVNQLLGAEYSAEILDMLASLMPYAFDDAIYDNRAFLTAISATPLRPRPLAEVIGPITEYPIRSSWGAIHEDRPPLGMRPV
jgi:hypothetical protein